MPFLKQILYTSFSTIALTATVSGIGSASAKAGDCSCNMTVNSANKLVNDYPTNPCWESTPKQQYLQANCNHVNDRRGSGTCVLPNGARQTVTLSENGRMMDNNTGFTVALPGGTYVMQCTLTSYSSGDGIGKYTQYSFNLSTWLPSSNSHMCSTPNQDAALLRGTGSMRIKNNSSFTFTLVGVGGNGNGSGTLEPSGTLSIIPFPPSPIPIAEIQPSVACKILIGINQGK